MKVTSHWKTVTRTLRPKNVSNGRPGALSGNRSMVRPTTSCEAAWIRKRQRIPPWTVLKATCKMFVSLEPVRSLGASHLLKTEFDVRALGTSSGNTSRELLISVRHNLTCYSLLLEDRFSLAPKYKFNQVNY